MTHPQKEPKEIRLFGEKSVREEAYRQKILQLEKDIASLELLAKDANDKEAKPKKSSSQIDGLYYESLLSFDTRVKKEQELLERRATDITERLDLQAQRLILKVESSFRHKTKWFFISIFSASIIVVGLLIVAAFIFSANTPDMSNIKLFVKRSTPAVSEMAESRVSYLKTALQTQARYRHQYEVTVLNLIGSKYIADIELKAPPESKWYLKNLSSEVTDLFQRYGGGLSAEISFLCKGKLYVKAYLSRFPQKQHFQYFY